jgi:tetratricopeptide (TPR) repeat protein
VPVELNESYEAIYQRAIDALAGDDTDQAIQLLWRIVNRLTRLRPETLQRREALERTLRTAWHSLAQILRSEGRYEEAIQACEAVAGHLSGARAPERMVASIRIEQGAVEEGLSELRQIAEETSSMAAWTDLGAEYAGLERYAEAESAYKAALRLATSNEEAAFVNLALFRTYQEMGRIEDALSTWSMVTVLQPDLATHVMEVYSWLIECGELERARRYVAREEDPARRMLYEGLIEQKTGHEEQARSIWQHVVKLDPKVEGVSEEAWSEAALRLGKPQQVLSFEESVTVDLNLVSVGQATLFGIASAAAGKADTARKWFDQVRDELERAGHPTGRIEARYRDLLAQVVSDQETVQALRSYFEEE